MILFFKLIFSYSWFVLCHKCKSDKHNWAPHFKTSALLYLFFINNHVGSFTLGFSLKILFYNLFFFKWVIEFSLNLWRTNCSSYSAQIFLDCNWNANRGRYILARKFCLSCWSTIKLLSMYIFPCNKNFDVT